MTEQTENYDEFLQRADAELSELINVDLALAAQEDGVRRKRAELGERIERIRASVRTYHELMGIEQQAVPSSELFGGEIPQGTIADMAAKLIETRGGPMKVADIVTELEKLGKLKPGGGGDSGRGNYGTVFGTLDRSRRFVKTGAGEFGIADTGESDRGRPLRQAESSRDAPYCKRCGSTSFRLDADANAICRQCGFLIDV